MSDAVFQMRIPSFLEWDSVFRLGPLAYQVYLDELGHGWEIAERNIEPINAMLDYPRDEEDPEIYFILEALVVDQHARAGRHYMPFTILQFGINIEITALISNLSGSWRVHEIKARPAKRDMH